MYIFVCHAEPDYSMTENTYQDTYPLDPSIDPRSLPLITRLATTLESACMTSPRILIRTSPYQRAVQTALNLAEDLGTINVTIDPAVSPYLTRQQLSCFTLHPDTIFHSPLVDRDVPSFVERVDHYRRHLPFVPNIVTIIVTHESFIKELINIGDKVDYLSYYYIVARDHPCPSRILGTPLSERKIMQLTGYISSFLHVTVWVENEEERAMVFPIRVLPSHNKTDYLDSDGSENIYVVVDYGPRMHRFLPARSPTYMRVGICSLIPGVVATKAMVFDDVTWKRVVMLFLVNIPRDVIKCIANKYMLGC